MLFQVLTSYNLYRPSLDQFLKLVTRYIHINIHSVCVCGQSFKIGHCMIIDHYHGFPYYVQAFEGSRWVSGNTLAT